MVTGHQSSSSAVIGVIAVIGVWPQPVTALADFVDFAVFGHFQQQLADIRARLTRRRGQLGRRHGSVVIDQRIQDNAPLIGATHVRGVTENRPLPITEGNSRLLFLDIATADIERAAVLIVVQNDRGVRAR